MRFTVEHTFSGHKIETSFDVDGPKKAIALFAVMFPNAGLVELKALGLHKSYNVRSKQSICQIWDHSEATQEDYLYAR